MGDSNAHVQTIDVRDGLFATRPDDGIRKFGKPVELWANYFPIIFKKPGLVLYIYEMTFKSFYPVDSTTPDKELTVPEGKKLIQVVRCALKTSNFVGVDSHIATDFSKKLISCTRLEQEQMKTKIFDFWAENEIVNGTPRPRQKPIRFQMFLAHTQELHLSDLTAYLLSHTHDRVAYERSLPIVQAFDIILGYRAKSSLEVATPKQGKVFPWEPTDAARFELNDPERNPTHLRGIFGFFASVRATTNRTLVNCNACCGAFYKPGPLKNLFAMFIPDRGPSLEQCKRLESTIRGLRVELTHLRDDRNQPIRALRTIFGLAHPYGGPNDVKFDHEADEKTYTVSKYWSKQGYGYCGNEAYPIVNVGNKDHPTYVPAEVCEIFPGQMAKKKLDSTQNSDMMKHARRDPGQIKWSIEHNAFDVLKLTNNPTLHSFGVSLGREMISVQGRTLRKPSIVYDDRNDPVRIGDNSRWNVRSRQVCQPKSMQKWGILRIARNPRDKQDYAFDQVVREFLNTLRVALGKQNVGRDHDQWTITTAEANPKALMDLLKLRKKDGFHLLVVVLPDNDASRYNLIKRIGDIDCGIRTVCTRYEKGKFQAGKDQYFANVALKINLKLGGINHKLRDQKRLYTNTMVIGIDVTHPSPGATKKTAPSVAAMAASVDSELGQWLADLRINTAGQEMVDLLSAMLRTRLELWKTRHGQTLPENLLIYRDGVSESQYKAVLQEEVQQLRNTCKVMYAGTRQPKITLIIVGKRHHTRFFRKEGQDMNPECGTVVDTGVTEARNWDFFLQSHHALIGTARPAHYFVLLNEIFTKEFIAPYPAVSDYLHELTYEMCYLFGRSTGPVSIPPPVYYAHLACERSRCYGDFDDNISDTSSMIGDDRGGPQGGRESGSQPGPSKQRKEDASKKQQKPIPTRTPDIMAALTKKQKAKLFEENMAAASQRAAEASSKAEGKKSQAKPETKEEGKKPQPATEGKVEGKKPQAGPEAKMTGKGKGKAEGKMPEKEPGRKDEKEKTKEDTQSKAQGKKPEQEAESKKPEKAKGKEPEAQAKKETSIEKGQYDIAEELKDTMFFI